MLYFLQVNDNKDNQVVTAGSLEITYDKGNVVTVPEVESIEGNCLMPSGTKMEWGVGMYL